MRHGEAFFREAAAACAALGRRALLVTPYREQLPKPLPPGTEQVDYAPFGTLFRSAAAVVHHGGIGTTAQALKAGVPQLVMPMAHDQPDNAARLERLGVGAWIAPRRFSAGRVAGALERLLGSEAVRTRCTEIARRFDGTGGLDAACEALEACAREVGDPDPRRYPPRSDR
jgi:UDP:flavonoid glycosyltransferase YjiC (YdhE family)